MTGRAIPQWEASWFMRSREVADPSLWREDLYFRATTGYTSYRDVVETVTAPYVMTQGGPAESTLSLVLLMYEEGFRWWNLGYAAAVAFVLFVLILAVTALPLAVRRLAAGRVG